MLLGRGASLKSLGIFDSTPLLHMQTTIQFFVHNPSFLKFAVAKSLSSSRAKDQNEEPERFGQVVFTLSWLVLIPWSLKQAK